MIINILKIMGTGILKKLILLSRRDK